MNPMILAASAGLDLKTLSPAAMDTFASDRYIEPYRQKRDSEIRTIVHARGKFVEAPANPRHNFTSSIQQVRGIRGLTGYLDGVDWARWIHGMICVITSSLFGNVKSVSLHLQCLERLRILRYGRFHGQTLHAAGPIEAMKPLDPLKDILRFLQA